MVDDVFKKVKEIIIEQLGVDDEKVNLDTNIQEDLGADSLDIVDLIMSLEEEYDIEIPDEDVEKIKLVDDIVKYIDGKLNKTEE